MNYTKSVKCIKYLLAKYFITTTSTWLSVYNFISKLSHHRDRIPLHIKRVSLSPVLWTKSCQRVSVQTKFLGKISRSLVYKFALVLVLVLLFLPGVAGHEAKVGHDVTAGRDDPGEGGREAPGIVPVPHQLLGRQVVHVVQTGEVKQMSGLLLARLQPGHGEHRGRGEEGDEEREEHPVCCLAVRTVWQ